MPNYLALKEESNNQPQPLSQPQTTILKPSSVLAASKDLPPEELEACAAKDPCAEEIVQQTALEPAQKEICPIPDSTPAQQSWKTQLDAELDAVLNTEVITNALEAVNQAILARSSQMASDSSEEDDDDCATELMNGFATDSDSESEKSSSQIQNHYVILRNPVVLVEDTNECHFKEQTIDQVIEETEAQVKEEAVTQVEEEAVAQVEEKAVAEVKEEVTEVKEEVVAEAKEIATEVKEETVQVKEIVDNRLEENSRSEDSAGDSENESEEDSETSAEESCAPVENSKCQDEVNVMELPPQKRINPQLAIQEDFDLSAGSESGREVMDALSDDCSGLRRIKSRESVDSGKFCLTETEFSDWADNSLGGDIEIELDIHPASKKDITTQGSFGDNIEVGKDFPVLDDIEFADGGEDRVPDVPIVPEDSVNNHLVIKLN